MSRSRNADGSQRAPSHSIHGKLAGRLLFVFGVALRGPSLEVLLVQRATDGDADADHGDGHFGG